MPKDNKGTIAPPVTALLAVSGATTPAILPLPKVAFSFSFRSEFFACAYAKKAAMGPPEPGIAPIEVQSPVHRNIKLKYFLIKEKPGNVVFTSPILKFSLSSLFNF